LLCDVHSSCQRPPPFCGCLNPLSPPSIYLPFSLLVRTTSLVLPQLSGSSGTLFSSYTPSISIQYTTHIETNLPVPITGLTIQPPAT
jgi:hypothetical protein